jgi:hypothetical protein
MTRITKRRLITFSAIIAVTAVAALAGFFWGLSPFSFTSYMSNHVPTEREMIDYFWPHRIVQPGWFANTPDGTLRWTVSEVAARLAVIGACWFSFGVWICRRHWRQLRCQ